MNLEAIFSDGTEMFRSPSEPMPFGYVTIRCRVAKGDANKVNLVSNTNIFEMSVASQDDLFDMYEATVYLTAKSVCYHFEIHSDESVVYYNRLGASYELKSYGDFKIIPGFTTPKWAKGAVMYQIFTDRFYNGDKSNDVLTDEYNYIGEHVSRVDDWSRLPSPMDVREFYGGDIQGIIDKLDYLSWLGIEVIYLNPIFVSPSNHKYDIQDYDYIDPHFGKIVSDSGELLQADDKDNKNATRYIDRVTNRENLEASNALFATLVNKAHEKGIKVIIDGVFNHCGSFNLWLDRERIYENQSDYENGAYIDGNSPYTSYFGFANEEWPYNNSYEGWWGHDTLPKLNYEASPELCEYILKIGAKWVSEPYNVDGWRLDVAADLGHSSKFNHEFWKKFRKSVKQANPDAIILAEHYGDSIWWLEGDEWDTIMNYDAFMEPVSWFLTGMQKHSDGYSGDLRANSEYFFSIMNEKMLNMTTSSLQTAMNELSNHDHSRFLTRTNHKVGRIATLGSYEAETGINPALMRAAVIIQMTWPGAPTVYYGDEAGVCGWTDPDNRRTYPWGKEDAEMLSFHKEVIRIHKDYQALKTGSLIRLYAANGVISYARFDENDVCVVIINSTEEYRCIDVPVWCAGVTDNMFMYSMINSGRNGYWVNAVRYMVNNGHITVDMSPNAAIIIKTI